MGVVTVQQMADRVSELLGEKLRVNGKKRDDLQAVIAMLRKSDFELPLQFDNFRD
jgi:uncharacterized protein YajQ (UPF0234 family)